MLIKTETIEDLVFLRHVFIKAGNKAGDEVDKTLDEGEIKGLHMFQVKCANYRCRITNEIDYRYKKERLEKEELDE